MIARLIPGRNIKLSVRGKKAEREKVPLDCHFGFGSSASAAATVAATCRSLQTDSL